MNSIAFVGDKALGSLSMHFGNLGLVFSLLVHSGLFEFLLKL